MMATPTEGLDVHSPHQRAGETRSPFIPLLVLALAVAGWFCYQTAQLAREGDNLQTARAAQDRSVQESKKLRDSLDAIARDTALLADKGNAGAKLIVDELRKRGVTINPNVAPPAATK
jgi:hypothetical protein